MHLTNLSRGLSIGEVVFSKADSLEFDDIVRVLRLPYGDKRLLRLGVTL